MSDQNVFERVEKKYRMNQKQYDLFLSGAAGNLHMDEYGLHTIRNIYYDTPNYELIRRSIDKPKYKEKLRKTAPYFWKSRKNTAEWSTNAGRSLP